jgi:hypothetical protein
MEFNAINKPLVVYCETDMYNENSLSFKKMLDKCGWESLSVGVGKKWNGFKTKVIEYQTFLKTLSCDKIIILSDSRDVFCLRNPITFINNISNITNIDDKIIISSEMFLCGHMDWSDEQINVVKQKDPNYFWQGIHMTKYWDYYNIQPPLRKYLNSGLIVGKVENLLKALDWILNSNFNDDQLGFSEYTNTFPERVFLDANAEIFHTSGFGVNGGFYDVKQKHDSPNLSELFGYSSYFLHVPGINGSKGQKIMYDFIKNMLDTNNVDQNTMAKLYGIEIYDSISYNYYEKNKR